MATSMLDVVPVFQKRKSTSKTLTTQMGLGAQAFMPSEMIEVFGFIPTPRAATACGNLQAHGNPFPTGHWNRHLG